MDPQGRTAAQKFDLLASDRYGVVTRGELLGVGITRTQIKRRLRNGSLIREHPGVYRVGHRAPSTEATYYAAVRACGDGALLCGRAAGYLWGLLKGSPPPAEVLAPTKRRVPGVITHRSRHIDRRDRTTWARIPVTTVARTLVDLAAVLSAEDLARRFTKLASATARLPHTWRRYSLAARTLLARGSSARC